MNLEKSTVISVVITLFPLSNHTVANNKILLTQFCFTFCFYFLFLFFIFLSLLLFLPINLFIFEYKVSKLDLCLDVQFFYLGCVSFTTAKLPRAGGSAY